MLPYQEHIVKRSSACDKTFTSCCTHTRSGFENLEIVLARASGVALSLQGIHRSSDCNETFTSYWKRARGGFGNLKNKIVLAGVPGVDLLEQTPFIRLR